MGERLRRKPLPPSPETIQLHPGPGAYLIDCTLLETDKIEALSQISPEKAQKEADRAADLANRSRTVIEQQDGTFNGIFQSFTYQEMEGFRGYGLHRLTFALANKG